MEEQNVWGKVIKASTKLPFVQVNREEFLRKELSAYYKDQQQLEAIIDGRRLIDQRVLDRLVNGCINYHTTVVTSVSALAGVPGGWALAAAVPADIAQFYGHVLCLAQKVMYLYGMPSLTDGEGRINDEAQSILTLFVGAMMGCQLAEAGIKELLEKLAQGIMTDIAVKRLGQTVLYRMAREVALFIGKDLTEKQFAKGLGKVIPLIGAPISGGITYFTFRPMAKRLKQVMSGQQQLRSSLMS